MCHEWTRVWQCNHGATPQEAPTLSLCTLGQLNLAEQQQQQQQQQQRTAAAAANCDPNSDPAALRAAQLRAACPFIQDVRILQAGWCRRCRDERRADPRAFEGRELCWKDEVPGSVM